eukprot:gene10509-biopygen10832
MARAWRGLQAILAWGGAGVARAWRGRGAGISCPPFRSPVCFAWSSGSHTSHPSFLVVIRANALPDGVSLAPTSASNACP